jgi:hypothetical protein
MQISQRKDSSFLLSFIFITLLIFSYLLGAYSYPRDLFPINLVKIINRAIRPPIIASEIVFVTPAVPAIPPAVVKLFDRFGRLTFSSDKTEVACPPQSSEMAVILAIGQSNSANSSLSKISPKFGQTIYNYFAGKCYIALSPLLGATGEGGGFITPLADHLIESRAYKSVVIVASGIGATPISRWQRHGDLNEMLLETISQLIKNYNPTHIVWHQGESDFINKTSAKVYFSSFESLKKSLNDIEVRAPFLIAIATQCNQPDWTLSNPTSDGQKSLLKMDNVFLGANTDVLLSESDRATDRCHFSESGLNKTAQSYAKAIMQLQANRH